MFDAGMKMCCQMVVAGDSMYLLRLAGLHRKCTDKHVCCKTGSGREPWAALPRVKLWHFATKYHLTEYSSTDKRNPLNRTTPLQVPVEQRLCLWGGETVVVSNPRRVGI